MESSKKGSTRQMMGITADLSLSRSTVKRALADLEKHGYLERESRFRDNGSHTSNLYRIK